MNRGFIQIPILVAILIGTAVIGSGGYFVVKEITKPTEVAETQTNEEMETTAVEQEETVVPREAAVPTPVPVIQTPVAPPQSAQTQKTEPISSQTSPTHASTTIEVSTTTPTTVPAAAPAPKVKVTATPSSVEYYGTSVISWVATDALSCTLDSSPVLLSVTGSQSVSPTDSSKDWSKSNKTTYTITCTGAGGTVSEDATVTVQPWVPPAGYQVLPKEQCNFATVGKCITGPGGWSCDNTNGRSCGG